jgi:hypothetical protein
LKNGCGDGRPLVVYKRNVKKGTLQNFFWAKVNNGNNTFIRQNGLTFFQIHFMYRNRNDLSQLIQAMSGGEKGYFVNFSKAFNAETEYPLYLQLFRQHSNSQSKQPEHFSGTTEKSKIMAKKRLYQNVMKSLRSYHQEKSESIIIQNILTEVEILYNLSLAQQSLFQLNKAHELATKYEKFGLLVQILEWESRLNVVLDEPTRTQEAIVKEEEQVLEKQRQFRFLENVFVKAETIKKKYGFVKGDMIAEVETETIHAIGMPLETQLLSEKAAFYYYFIYALYYWMTFQHERAFVYSQKLITPGINSIPPGDYINGLLEHITSCVCTGKFKDALKGIELGTAYIEKEKLTQSHAFTGRMFAYRSTYALIIYNYMGDVKKLKETILHTEQQLKHYDPILTFESKQVIIGNLMNAYMGLGNLKKADEIWDTMFNRHSQTVRRDIYADLHLFRLFSLLQSKSYSLLPSAANSAIRYFKKSDDAKSVFEVELPIATLLSKERRYEKPEILREVVEQIEAVVSNFISKLHGTKDFQEHYTRYMIWSMAIQQGEPYYIVAKKWYKSFNQLSSSNQNS